MTLESSAKKCKSILIVEDDREIREALAMLLEYEGYSVTCAVNGQEGIECLRTMPRPCLVLLDYMMPVMNGEQFIVEQTRDDVIAQIPVIVVSAYEDQVRKLNASGFVKKPIDLNLLLNFVNHHCSSL